MSFFYASPVEGEMHLHHLEKAVKERIEFLQALVTGAELKYSEYLLEGSAYDSAGHFTLHIIDSLSRNSDLSNLIRKGEIKLFERRLSYLNPSTLRIFSKKILRYIKRDILNDCYSEALLLLCMKTSLLKIAEHMCSNHPENCNRHNISIHFTLCLPFVSNREVEIKSGKADIPCRLWFKYLTILFRNHLSARDKLRERLEVFRNDNRIMSIAAQYFTYGKGEDPSVSSDVGTLLSCDVDTQSQYFPPCMKNLHNEFRKHHRLSHDQRFYYTCFLKDIGMPVSEAVKFWKEEYSKSSCTNACQHSWAADGAKYIRSIRHTYGLEGSKTSYSCPGCNKIQSSSGARGEGGCPFKSFSKVNMNSILSPDFINSPLSMAAMETYLTSGHYTNACKYYLNTVHPNVENLIEDRPTFLTPVRFYSKSSKII